MYIHLFSTFTLYMFKMSLIQFSNPKPQSYKFRSETGSDRDIEEIRGRRSGHFTSRIIYV